MSLVNLMMQYITRLLEANDESFLQEALYQALFALPNTSLSRDIIKLPELAKYIQNWERDKDIGFIAIVEKTQQPVGAAWLRTFTSNCPGYGYIDDETPELSISVLPKYRGRGIGTSLLARLLDYVRDSYAAISLSVSPNNPALHLYQRFEFYIVEQNETSIIMRKQLKKW